MNTPKRRLVRHEMQYRVEQDLPAAAGLSKAQQQTLRDLLAKLATRSVEAAENLWPIAQTVDEITEEPSGTERTSYKQGEYQKGFQ